ncbi:glycosyltransferase family 4 protein [Winogradskyella bathintestinalis]|uniref:Glycosyltransferase family 4 protein n=1 Tax=Winogradskyella bathintestinalis TaxID=3035208 RepID=A0ABT7ZUL1_9FLAO|nr:glycosyltransferase family 4 protein [Winogradskyella bathintestinalis]MDN3492413.1 glycosyltransferase family 4 protein [Winogradskyella bathintestinalis]
MNNSTADYFITLSNKLSKDNKVVVLTSKIRKTNITLDESITILKWPTKRPTTWKGFWFLCKLVRDYKPDIMISMFSFVNLFLIVGWLYRIKIRVAWIRTLSSQYAQKKHKVYRKSVIYGLSTDIITNSVATKKDVSSFFYIPDRKITVLPNSVKDYSDSLQDIMTATESLLYVGRLHPSKGIDVLIQSFSQLLNHFPKLRLVIIGHGHILNDLVKLTESLGVSNRVSFLGEKDKETVLKAYKKSYCTIIPSHSEAFGFTVIEAMSVGTCVIGANNTGIKEIIIHEETGLLFETGNIDDLTLQLGRILNDKDFRNNLARNGYQRFFNKYENTYAINRDSEFFKRKLSS